MMTKIRKSRQTVLQEIFWTAVAAIFIFLPKALLPANGADQVIVMKMVISAHGKDRCPEASTDGPKVVLKARSRLDCARMCASRKGCIHQAFHKNNGSCIHYYSTPAKLIPAKDCNFMVNPKAFEGCFPKAMVRTGPNSCSLPFLYANKQYDQCIPGTQNSTPQCVTSNGQLTDCITPPGFSVQQQVVNLPVGTSHPLPCVSDWIIVMQRFNGSVDFMQNWTQYRNGFGDFTGSDFWIGNEKMRAITNEPGAAYMLRIEVQTFKSGFWYYAEYDSFRIDSEDNKYALHVSGYSGNAGDSVANITNDPNFMLNGMYFSTYDADNDMNPDGSCVGMFNGSWWFNNCWWSCLTCKFNSKYFAWTSLDTYGLQNVGKLRAARMMIRSI